MLIIIRTGRRMLMLGLGRKLTPPSTGPFFTVKHLRHRVVAWPGGMAYAMPCRLARKVQVQRRRAT